MDAKKEITKKILSAFDELSQRNTQQRRLIATALIELANDGADFTTDDLWRRLRQDEPKIGRATVFRSVEKLVEIGLLDRVDFADGTHHYRICSGIHHHHLTCTHCHRVVEIDICLPADRIAAVSEETNFAIEGHSITIFGRCPSCHD